MSEKKSELSGNVFDFNILKRTFRFVKPYIGQFYLVTFLTIILGVTSPIIPFLVNITIDNYIVSKEISGLLTMLILMVVALFFNALLQYFHTLLSGWIGQTVIRDIRTELYRHILKLKLKFFDNTPIGRLVTRNISDIETLSDVFTQGVASIIGDILQIIVILLVMLMIDWRITLVGLSTLPILLLSTYVFKEKIKIVFNQVRTAVANLNSFVQEHISGMSIVQIFNSENEELRKFEKINKEHTKANIKSVLYYSIYFPVAEIIAAISIALLVWYGAGHVVENTPREGIFGGMAGIIFGSLDQNITIGTVTAFIMYINMFFRPIRMIADRFNTLQMGVVSSKRILDLLDNKDQIANNGNLIPENIKGNISFKNVWFAYNDENYVLKNISFNVNTNETLAFVGATGAGKTSIINLINRFYDINKGEILVDDINIKDYDLFALRKSIGVVFQDVFLFRGTIAENISLGDTNITQEQIWEAAKKVGADKFINNLPGKLNYEVMERGATLSVGQRQLISFVRTMVYNPKILILDEATSSVDTETEEMIQFAIDKMMQGRTSIVIAHRLSTIQKATKIIVLDKGEIKEQGTHSELLKNNGLYNNLYNMQFASLEV